MTADKALAVYGKSFHWARRFLGQHMGMKAAQLYQFCRILDDMADGDIEHGPKRLGRIRKNILTTGIASDPLLTHFQPFLTKQEFPTEVIVALIDGLLSDQRLVRIKSDAELLSYAYHVAGTVGILMCDVLDCNDEQALSHAIDLGIAMQLTNIARDVLEDAGMGRRYLPASWVGNLTPEQIVTLSKTPDGDAALQITNAVSRLLTLAEDYYKSGITGLSYLPLRAHISIAVAALVYRQIGVQLAQQNYPWHSGRQSTSINTKIKCSLRAVGTLRLRFQKATPHDSSLHDTIVGLPHVR
ncbi:phytoene/squalene synthase family protein [Alphaproteobacteria bacterium]|nr:phytoene/squalene synthase family protein [Alphaproteobacteria bacterium]